MQRGFLNIAEQKVRCSVRIRDALLFRVLLSFLVLALLVDLLLLSFFRGFRLSPSSRKRKTAASEFPRQPWLSLDEPYLVRRRTPIFI